MYRLKIDSQGLITAGDGLCRGHSVDGSVAVAILGETNCTDRANSLAQAYVDAGRRVQVSPHGSVRYVIYDQRKACASVIAEPIGLQQTYWATTDGTLHLGSSPNSLVDILQETAGPNLQAIFNYTYFHCLPSPVSIYTNLSRLEAGHVLNWNGQTATATRYWHPHFVDSPPPSEIDSMAELLRLLRIAVERCLEDNSRCGAFLSGGLDSSTVAGMASQLRHEFPTVSMGFRVSGYDEMEYARLAARHFSTRSIEYYVTPEDVLDSLPDIAAAFPEPFGNSSAAATYHCARVAHENGLQVLLAGDGGDELFGGNDRYAKQLTFEHYHRIPLGIRRAILEPIINTTAEFTSTFPIDKAASYIRQANIPLPDRLQTYNFLHRHDPAEVFSPELLNSVDQLSPIRALRSEYSSADTQSVVNRMLFLDWKFTLHDNDLVKVTEMCRLAGVRVKYPMLDQALVDFSLRIPGDWKVRNQNLRWFYKRALSDFLPRAIIDKKKHGFGLPFGVWTRTHSGLRRLSRECLESLSNRRYFRREFIHEALRLYDESHAAYYGELVWILMTLELWLQRHMPRASL